MKYLCKNFENTITVKNMKNIKINKCIIYYRKEINHKIEKYFIPKYIVT